MVLVALVLGSRQLISDCEITGTGKAGEKNIEDGGEVTTNLLLKGHARAERMG